MRKDLIKNTVVYFVLSIASVIALLPIFWMAILSIKVPSEWYARPPVWFPPAPTADNYVAVFNLSAELPESIAAAGGGGFAVPAIKPILNSVMIAGGGTALAVIIGFLAAYAMSRYRTGGGGLYYFVMVTRIWPPVAIIIPLLIFYGTIGLVDTVAGMIVLYLGLSVAFVIWIVKGFLDEVPVEIEEVSMLDGYSRLGVLFKVVLPISKGALGAAALFVFIINWGEFLGALVLTRSDAFTIPVQLFKYNSFLGAMLGPIGALSTVAIIPVIIMGFFIQKQLIRGLTFGVLKGR